jgi:hypothetical protein
VCWPNNASVPKPYPAISFLRQNHGFNSTEGQAVDFSLFSFAQQSIGSLWQAVKQAFANGQSPSRILWFWMQPWI